MVQVLEPGLRRQADTRGVFCGLTGALSPRLHAVFVIENLGQSYQERTATPSMLLACSLSAVGKCGKIPSLLGLPCSSSALPVARHERPVQQAEACEATPQQESSSSRRAPKQRVLRTDGGTCPQLGSEAPEPSSLQLLRAGSVHTSRTACKTFHREIDGKRVSERWR